jgi:hypothetical protein
MLHYGHLVMLGIGGGDVDATRHHVTSTARRGQNPWIVFVCEGLATIAIMSFTRTVMKGAHSRLLGLLEQTRSKQDTLDVKGLVRRWSWLHLARSLLLLVGTLLGITGSFDNA